MENIKVTSTSKNSAIVDDIILRVTETTRLIFRPIIVNNLHDPLACVKGWFIFQKKKQSGNWEDYKDFPLSKLRDNEWIKLELKAGEIHKLWDECQKLRRIYDEFGIIFGETSFRINSGNLEEILLQFSKLENRDIILDKLEKLEPDDLQNIDSIIGIGKFKKALEFWEDNKNNEEEEFWQNYFKANSWIISQIFAYSAVLLEDKAYVGGKDIGNKGSGIVDFIYQNDLTKNTALVEIKTPCEKLISGIYRKSNGIYSISSNLTGAINQILNYRDSLQKRYYQLLYESESDFNVFNPKCIVIVGSLEIEKLSDGKLKSFELFRNSNKDVEIVTYDELFKKIEVFLGLLTN